MNIVDIRMPDRKTKYRRRVMYELFMGMNIKTARFVVEDNDYANIHTAYYSLRQGIEMYKLPIKINRVHDDIYMIRTDF